MVDPSNYATDDSNDSETSDDSDSVSTTHLYIVENGDPNGRGAGRNHHPDAFDHLSQGGDIYKAFTERGSGRRNEWSLSDTLSHIAMSYEDLVEALPVGPEGYVHFTNDVMGAATAAVEGDNDAMMDWIAPSADDLADYVERSDDVDAEDLAAALGDD